MTGESDRKNCMTGQFDRNNREKDIQRTHLLIAAVYLLIGAGLFLGILVFRGF